MAEKLSLLLHRFLDLYDRSPLALESLLDMDDPFFMLEELDTAVAPSDQYNLLLATYRKVREETLAKTLIQTSGPESRLESLREQIDKPGLDSVTYELTLQRCRRLPEVKLDPETVKRISHEASAVGFREGPVAQMDYVIDQIDIWTAGALGLTVEDYRQRRRMAEAADSLSTKRIDSEFVRFFADRLDTIVADLNKLNDARFDLLIPRHLVAPFRELHVNAVLGNYGTACILCGALLEKALQDLIPSENLLKDLIVQAKAEGLLNGHNRRYADRIQIDRNNAAHGRVEFDSIDSSRAWETIDWTRKLVAALYKDRLQERES